MVSLKEWLNKFYAYFKSKPVPPPTTIEVNMSLSQKAYELAKSQLGTKEVPGDGNNPKVLEYHQSTDLRATEDSVPWCSAFMNWCIQGAGGKGTRDAMARSWLHWGQKIETPKEGDTVIFSSPLRGQDSGHVAFYVSHSPVDGFIKVLGGNQKDAVCYAVYPTLNILGYRRSLDG